MLSTYINFVPTDSCEEPLFYRAPVSSSFNGIFLNFSPLSGKTGPLDVAQHSRVDLSTPTSEPSTLERRIL